MKTTTDTTEKLTQLPKPDESLKEKLHEMFQNCWESCKKDIFTEHQLEDGYPSWLKPDPHGYPRAVPTDGGSLDEKTPSPEEKKKLNFELGLSYVKSPDIIEMETSIKAIQENLEQVNCVIEYFKRFYTVDWKQEFQNYQDRKSKGGTKDEHSGEHTEG